MKVLQLTAHFHPNLGGVETHLSDLVSELDKRDISTFVLTYIPLTTDVKYKLFEKRKSTNILRIPWIKGLFYKFVSHPVFEFLYLFPGLFFVTPFVLLSFHPKVIHSHGLVAGAVGVIWGKIFNRRVIVTTHSIYHFPKQGAYHHFVKWLFTNADHILTLSNQSKHEIENIGIASKKITVFTYWVDQSLFIPKDNTISRKKFKLGKEFIVLFVGRLVPEKGILVLLDAFENITTSRLLIAGDGPLRPRVEERIKDKKNVTYLGRTLQNDLPDLYNVADVLIVPSIHEEGFGRIILESLSCGTPVIASKRGGIVEALDKSVGELIEVTPKNIKTALTEMQKHIKKYSGNEIVSYAKMRFSANNINAIINAYEQ